jgi:hypothetical protein
VTFLHVDRTFGHIGTERACGHGTSTDRHTKHTSAARFSKASIVDRACSLFRSIMPTDNLIDLQLVPGSTRQDQHWSTNAHDNIGDKVDLDLYWLTVDFTDDDKISDTADPHRLETSGAIA